MIKPFWWWTDKQRELAKDVYQFGNDNMEAAEAAHAERRVPWDVIKKIQEKGYSAVGVPTEYGGRNLGTTGSCIAAEGLARLYTAGSLFIVSQLAGFHQLLIYGTEEQKQKFLRQIAEGKIMGALCITEPFAGSDAANVYTKAVKNGDTWIVNGKKRMITNAGSAGRYFVYIKTSDDPVDRKQYNHLTAFILERGMKGFSLEKINMLIGFDNTPNGYLNFDNVEVPDVNRIGAVGQGWQVMMSGLNFERIIGSCSAGGLFLDVIRSLNHFIERRVQFNQPVGRFTNLQFELADIIARYYNVRLLAYHTAYLLDHRKEFKLNEMDLSIWASVTKKTIADYGRETGLAAVQMTGGDGLTQFYPLQRLLRDSKIFEIGAGTTTIQRIIIYRMARQLRGFLDFPFYYKLHETVGVPILTKEPSKWEGCEITKENLLKILGEDFKINPGLYMTVSDFKMKMKGKKKIIIQKLEELVKENLIAVLRKKDGTIKLAKANYEGLKKAYPNDYYKWFPDWIKDDEFIMEMTKF